MSSSKEIHQRPLFKGPTKNSRSISESHLKSTDWVAVHGKSVIGVTSALVLAVDPMRHLRADPHEFKRELEERSNIKVVPLRIGKSTI